MNELEEKILDEYAFYYRVEAESYKMMGKMLDESMIYKRLKLYNISELYIYGGTYLAAQLFRVAQSKVDIKGIVDRDGRLAVKINVPVYTLEDLKKMYINEKIIITPPQYYREIKKSLLQFAKEEDIIFLGDFLEGLW